MSKFKSFFNKLKDKYRLTIINESSFEEKISFRLSRWNVIMLGATFSVLLAILVLMGIIFTPLKTMVPGYSNIDTVNKAKIAIASVEIKENKLRQYENYLANLKKVLNGELDADSVRIETEITETYDDLDYSISTADSLLRAEIEAQEKYNIEHSSSAFDGTDLSDLNFFCPLHGDISSPMQVGIRHFGVDVVAPANKRIYSILDGVVVLSTWSSEEGYVLMIQHSDNVVSIYKHNSVLFKKTGDMVKVGESIAIIGNSGELTDGPHLHFEMWYNGNAINPTDYIDFK